nr:glycosyltransferase [Anseongella ginsenosidimutans]
MAERLAKQGNRVFVITSGSSTSVARLHGVAVIRIKQRNVFSTYSNSKSPGWLKSIWHLLDSCNPLNYFLISGLLKRIKPDVVHTNNIQGFSPFIWAIVKKQQLPLVHTFRDYYMLCHRTTLYHNERKCTDLCWQCKITHGIKKNFAGYPDCYVGVSNFILEKHAAYLPMRRQRTQVIYDVVEMPPEIPAKNTGGEEVIFGFIGRVSKAKGAEYLAKELANIKEEFRSGFKLVFAGKGDETFVRSLRDKLDGIKVEFPGFVESDGFYRQIDVLIVPSLWSEPFGRIVIESLSHSVPVCIARSGGLEELHHPLCTWSFAPREGELSKLIEHILLNKGEISAKGEFCRKHASRFSPEHHDQEYLDTYTDLNSGPAYTLAT